MTGPKAPCYPVHAELFVLPPANGIGAKTQLLHARSFTIAWSNSADEALDVVSEHEYFVLLPAVGASLTHNGRQTIAPPGSVCIVPPGHSAVRPDGAGDCIRIFSKPPAGMMAASLDAASLDAASPNALAMKAPDLRATTPMPRIASPGAPIVHILAEFPNSRGMPRAKLFQTSTISINWVEYTGPRNRTQLSPHAHVDIEQGSVAIEGDFIHHFRTPWDQDADRWQADQHIKASARTIALIPPPVIHTTEGVGSGRHILIDVFSPARQDFIAKGQILNSGDYRQP